MGKRPLSPRTLYCAPVCCATAHRLRGGDFVEAQRFAGTCYRAANWTCVGQTQGRGKLGDHRLAQVPVKTVWVYPLARDFRAQLCR